MTPYRSARVEGRAPDPSRAKLGLAGAAIASLAVFVSVVRMVTHAGPSVFDGVLLYAGSAVMGLMLVYSALDAPAGRGLLLASVAAFLLSFVPQTMVRSLMTDLVFPARYYAVGGIAAGLLLRARRTRPGSYGVALRLAAMLAVWWASAWVFGMSWPDGSLTARSELASRALYVLLAAGMLDLRRCVGAVPEREHARTPIDTAREIATTRVCLGAVSCVAAVSALPYAWHSEWVVICAAEGLALVVTLSFHVPWLIEQQMRVAPFAIAVIAVFAFAVGCRAFDARALAPFAALSAALVALATDFEVARVVAPALGRERRSAQRLAIAAMALHAVNALVIVARV